jgi:hypothetical protein
MILILTLCLLFSVSAIVGISDATTTFGGSRVIAIDQEQRTITFKTNEGQTWTLPVTDPDLLNRHPLPRMTSHHRNRSERPISNVIKLSDVPTPPVATHVSITRIGDH